MVTASRHPAGRNIGDAGRRTGERQRGGVAGGGTGGRRDDDGVGAHATRIDIGETEDGAVGVGDRRAVEEPLINERRGSQRFDREDRARARRHDERLRVLQERDVAIRVENVFQDGIRAGRVVGQFHESRDAHRDGVGNVVRGHVGRSRRTIDLIIEGGGARLAEEGGVRRVRERNELGERGIDAHATDIIAATEGEAGRVVAAELEVL